MSKRSFFKHFQINRQEFWKQTGAVVVGTTISLVVTLASSMLIERQHKAQGRKLTAMMVMSNIESFARSLDNRSNNMAHLDSVGCWLLAQPLEALDTLPDEELTDLVHESLQLQFLNHDHTAENIFSNHIETWQNVGNFEFIDKVGQCFSAINQIEDYWNGWANEVEDMRKQIAGNPDDYPGVNKGSKLIHNSEIRNYIARIHNWRGWMKYAAATLRYHNRENLRSMGITEEDLMAFTDERTKEVTNDEPVPVSNDYYLPALNPDSIFLK